MSPIDAHKTGQPDDSPPRDRLSHLEETTRFALAALDQAAALSDFSLSLARMAGPEPILDACLQKVGKLMTFDAVGVMLVDEEDSSFHMVRTEPAEEAQNLDDFARACIEDGTFAFALREKRAVLPLAAPGQPRRLLHVITTASRTRGMFVASFARPLPGLSEVSLSILSIVLGNTAQALENLHLHQRIQAMNSSLEDKVSSLASSESELMRNRDNQDRLIEEKTRELQATLNRLEEEVRHRKKAETLLETLNQRLEAKVEVRTKALFRKVAEMEAANKQLKQLERLKSSFLSSVSHELRTPLTSIMGFAKLIAKDFERFFRQNPDSPLWGKAVRILRNLGIVEKESERLTRLINDVLDLTRIESGKMPWRDERVSIVEVVADAVMALEGRFEARPAVSLRLDMPKRLPRVVADRDRILQVLINLLDNALKFTEEGQVTVEAGLTEDGSMLLVCVEDTGPGIAPEEAEKVFDKFHQHDRKDTLKDKPKGTGLGLAICRHIVTRHGGFIWMEPARERGSVFCFTLPLGTSE
ncbi:GAF domain-containing sensor histidine kinase [Fundidesulfovibrio terrae]|uniref:GAF domain-containing sensor histidine kinase n=1 Tax=Fundidesulfovibrio terrae TaxID=2922866 RepID=UPI001FAF2F91|nr:ATP-binding protein [Fundidesulfovibrio terrae]